MLSIIPHASCPVLSEHSVLPPQLPTLVNLYGHFVNRADFPTQEIISGNDMPEPYRGLLVHTHHMTVTVEKYYGDAVHVQVLDSVKNEANYCRKILLTLKDSSKVVQFGIVRIDLTVLTSKVRDEIVAEKTPLGRVLIENNVLREVQPIQYFRAKLSAEMARWFGVAPETVTYGRIGVIYTDGQPAIHVAEILAPIGA